jgi:hypothetical protein
MQWAKVIADGFAQVKGNAHWDRVAHLHLA